MYALSYVENRDAAWACKIYEMPFEYFVVKSKRSVEAESHNI